MMEGSIVISNHLQFRSKSIVCYQRFHRVTNQENPELDQNVSNFLQSKRFKANAEKLRERAKYTGQITAGAKKRLTKAISLLVQSSPEKWVYNPVSKKTEPHKLSFITLTLPQVDKSKDAKFCHKHLLQPMLRILRNSYKMDSYVWKAELQSNGSIHYHLTTDLFIRWELLRHHWNRILDRNGMLEDFKKKYKHENPNSVDIHSVKKVNDLEAYLIKYISKEYQNQESLDGKVWDCSRNLKQAKYFTMELDFETHKKILQEIDLKWLQPFYRDRCTILKSRTTDYYHSFSENVINNYYSHLKAIKRWESNDTRQTRKSTTKLSTGSNITEKHGLGSASADGRLSGTIFEQLSIEYRMSIFGPR